MLLLKKNANHYFPKFNHAILTVGLVLIPCELFAATALSHQSTPNNHKQSCSQRYPTSIHKIDDTNSQLSRQVSQYFCATNPLTFRDITPTYVAEGFRHLQQVHNGVDVDGAILSVRLDANGHRTWDIMGERVS